MVVEYSNFLAEKGYDVTLWYSEINTVFKLHLKLKLIKIPFPTRLGTIIHLALKRFPSDVVIVDIVPLVLVASFRNGSRLIFFAQGYDESYYKNPLRRLLTKILCFFSLKLLRVKTIAVSNELTEMLKEKYNANVVTVENGIDFENFYHDRDEDLIRNKGDRKAILLLSRGDHTKGLDIAIKTLNKLSNDWKDKIVIWFCGETVKQEILKPEVINFGWIGEERLRKIISSADVLFYPTRHEGFGLLPLEAMACGCPVVTTNVVPYAKDGENALVAKVENENSLKEKLERILSDQHLKDKLKINGLNTVKKYDLNESKRKFEEAIEEIISPDNAFTPP